MFRSRSSPHVPPSPSGVQVGLRVRLGGERMTQLAKVYGDRDGSGIHPMVARLEAGAEFGRFLVVCPI